MEHYFSACPKDCYDSCSIITDIQDKAYIKGNPNHPITQGFLCYKSKFFVPATYSDKRILYPMKRIGYKGEGRFERIRWDQALNSISLKFKEILDKFGPDKILSVDYAGNKGLISYHFPQRLFNYLGTAKLAHSICDEAGQEALIDEYGTSVGENPLKILSSELIVFWGFNPVWSNIHGYLLAKKSKAFLITVDPVRSETAKKTDLHLRLKTSSDVALALGIANYLFEHNFADIEFLENNATGYRDFEKYVKKFDVPYVTEKTGLEKETFVEFCEKYGTLKKSIIHIGYGFQRSAHGAESVRAISLLPAIVGTYPGFMYNARHNIDYTYISGHNPHRLLIYQSQLGKEIVENDIKLLFVYNTNPLASLPNQKTLRDAILEKNVFMIVHDIFYTDTTDYADLILPATTFLEQKDLVNSYYHDFINLNEKVIMPMGESKSNHDLFVSLANSIGLNDPYLTEDEDSIISHILDHLKIDKTELFQNGFAKIVRVMADQKISFYSERAKKRGLSPFPVETEIHSPHKFQLLSVTQIEALGSQFNAIQKFDTRLRINDNDAKTLNLKDGDKILVQNEQGSLIMEVLTTSDIPSHTVLAYRGAWAKLYDGKNINFLTFDNIQKNYVKGTALQSTFVDLKKI